MENNPVTREETNTASFPDTESVSSTSGGRQVTGETHWQVSPVSPPGPVSPGLQSPPPPPPRTPPRRRRTSPTGRPPLARRCWLVC